MNYFLYVAIGKHDYLYETIYSIRSFERAVKDSSYRIVIYTDNEEFFQKYYNENYHVEINRLPSELTRQWLEKNVFSVKIYALKSFLAAYKSDVVFIDTDTFIYKDISTLFGYIEKDNFVMYRACTPLGQAVTILHDICKESINAYNKTVLEFYNYLIQNKYLVCGQKSYVYSQNFIPYNSGIIGISYENADLLDEVEHLNHFIYDTFGLYYAEEFAFATVFQRAGKIRTCNLQDKIYHYTKFYPYTRLLGGYILQYLVPDDKEQLVVLLNQYHIDLSKYDFDISEIEEFSCYVDGIVRSTFSKNETERDVDNEEKIARKAYYLHSKSDQYAAIYRKYLKMELK